MIKMWVLVCAINAPCDENTARVVIPIKPDTVVCAGAPQLSWEQKNMLGVQENETWKIKCLDEADQKHKKEMEELKKKEKT